MLLTQFQRPTTKFGVVRRSAHTGGVVGSLERLLAVPAYFVEQATNGTSGDLEFLGDLRHRLSGERTVPDGFSDS